MVYKLKVWTQSESDKSTGFKDLYFNVDLITGFYIPDKSEEDDDDYLTINIIHTGGLMTIIQEDHIIKYLKEKFVDKAITK